MGWDIGSLSFEIEEKNLKQGLSKPGTKCLSFTKMYDTKKGTSSEVLSILLRSFFPVGYSELNFKGTVWAKFKCTVAT